jgi:hypothetical protein
MHLPSPEPLECVVAVVEDESGVDMRYSLGGRQREP